MSYFKIIIYTALLLLIYARHAGAKEIDIWISGISTHLDASSSKKVTAKNSRKLDKNGQFVFNPGLGIWYDFRENNRMSGFSPVILALRFQDCSDKSVHFAGGGVRYKKFVTEKISLDGEIFLGIYKAKNLDTGKYKNVLAPFPALGANYHFDTKNMGVKFTFAPNTKTFTARGGFNIIFTSFALGIGL